ncbi:sirohydrochlorin chelatase [Leucothrix arctica]|uniref:Cobalamin biosynthesis protein CbiX n=1 Tax=Leucothrix arctica TaxID=1481894 RepID=A0A317C6L5_9GAMM|nr:CbiX/SirB N-terminal domain-containing protein [Leucothrix arctica]PWQ94285.1 cobalamin biosynthesis protein CbiX [Leucothrix arctica]
MKSLLLVAHGSRRESSNDAVKQLVTKLRHQLAGSGFDEITHAFLELTTPSIEDGVSILVDAGSIDIVVMPYFLAPGIHVVDDLPELIDVARTTYPSVNFTVTPHLGEVDGMVSLILQSAGATA